MNPSNDSFPHANAAIAAGGDHLDVPHSSMLPGSDKAASPASHMLERVVQGAHDTIDRLADSAGAQVERLDHSVAHAGAALHAGAEQVRRTRDDWTEGLRGNVRANPLAAVALALAFGALVGRITR